MSAEKMAREIVKDPTFRAELQPLVRDTIRRPNEAAEPPPDGARLTIKDVAARLNVNHQTVRQLIKTGAMRSVRVGGVYRFRQEWIDAFIDSAVEGAVRGAAK